MNEHIVEFAVFLGILTPIIIAFTEAIKRAISKLPNSFSPLLSVFIGLILAALATPFTDLGIDSRLWGGFLAGLSACGLYDVGKISIKR